tara:strand:+ start:605 stop:1261 length:657 start_codon:yes stop_codon:yes gene_type:complete
MKLQITIPESLADIPLWRYQKYLKLVEANKDDKNADKFLAIKMLEIFCGVPYESGVEYRVKDINSISMQISKVLLQKPDLVHRFNILEQEFGFIPNLEDMSFGEYVDLDTFISDWSQMHKTMAVLYRPVKNKIKNKYLIEDYKGDNYHEAMLHTPMDVVFGSMLFFYHLGNDLSKDMAKYLETVDKETLAKLEASAENGDGIIASSHWLKEMLRELKM